MRVEVRVSSPEPATAELADRLGVTKELHPWNIRVNSYQISVSRADEPTERQTFLNSYIVDDLLLISTALDRRDAGTALSQYLTASAMARSAKG